MVFHNKMDKLDFPKQQQTALDMLRDFIIFKSITVIKHDDLVVGDGIFNDEPDLAMFRNKKQKANCEPREFGSLYQDAGSKMCVLIN